MDRNKLKGGIADILVNNATILTMDDQLTVEDNGSIAIAGDRILWVGPTEACMDIEARRVIDAKNSIVIPGMVNTHCHVAMTMFRGIADNKPLDAFLKTVWAAEAEHVSEENVYASASVGIAEMAAAGITHFVDMYSYAAATLRAADRIGISVSSGPSFIGFARKWSPTWDSRISGAHEYLQELNGRPDVQKMVMPHSTYTLNDTQLRELTDLAEQYNCRMHSHGSEAPSEMAQAAQMHSGARPIQVFKDTGVLAHNVLIAHGVHLNDADRDSILSHGASISHCPLSNAKLASGTAPVRQLLDEGINVSLGTDGPSSSNDLDLWKAMRHAGYMQSLFTNDPVSLTAQQLVSMATRNGAKSLGMDHEFGSIEAGKRADIVVVSKSGLHMTPCYDPYSTLAYSAGRDDVSCVIAKGNVIVENGWVNVDLSSQIARIKEVAQQVQENKAL